MYPANLPNANSPRSNLPLADITGNTVFNYLEGSVGYNGNQMCYEPRDAQKGNSARSIFYHATCYNLQNNLNWGIAANQDQETLKTWHFNDLPDSYEIARQEYIFSVQGNRNPFIDNPYLATLIWNGPISEDLWGLLSTPDLDFKSVFIHPTIAQDHVYVEGLEVSKNAIQIYNQLGQKLEFELEGNKIDVSSLSKGMYLIQIQDRNQTKLFWLLVQLSLEFQTAG